MYNWKQRTEELAFELEDGSQVRYTFGVCTTMDQARYSANINRVFTLFRTQFGVERFSEAINAVLIERDGTPKQQDDVDAYYPLYLRLMDWAAFVVALRKVETRPDADGEWVEIEIPEELKTPATALESLWLPPGVLDAASEVVGELNPGVFTLSQKKAVRILDKTETTSETQSTDGAKTSSRRKKSTSTTTETS